MKKKLIKTGILIIGIVILYSALNQVGFEKVLNALTNFNPLLLLIALLFTILNLALDAQKWVILLKGIGVKMSFKEAVLLHWSTIPLGIIAPLRSNDLIKAYYLKKKKITSFKKGLSSILLENTLEVITILFFIVISFIFFKIKIASDITFWIILIGMGMGIIFILSNLFSNDLFYAFRNLNIKSWIKLIILNLLFRGSIFVQLYIIFLSLGVTIPIEAITGIYPIIIFIGYIPITLSGIGTRDFAFIYLLSEYALPEILLSASIFSHLTTTFIPAIVGLFAMKKIIFNFLEEKKE